MDIKPGFGTLAVWTGTKSYWKMKSAAPPQNLLAEGIINCSKISWKVAAIVDCGPEKTVDQHQQITLQQPLRSG